MVFLDIICNVSGNKIKTFMGASVSMVSEKAFDSGFCESRYK